MLKSFFSGIWTLIVDLSQTIWRFVTLNSSTSEFTRDFWDSLSATWQEGSSTALTGERKTARKYLKQGVKHYNSRRYSDALYSFRRSLDEDPNYARALLYYGNALYKLHEESAALEAWKRAIAVEPRSDSAKNAQLKLMRIREKNKLVIDEIQSQLSKK
ncbi:MAG: tetratricopeptide repeat protein [Candidatus Hydrogenedens sp.]|jgi:tetratricopeptide (TPR) repeat protein|nr:tetratricopeptide repeat protein [Candidatus Hydrogenedens sp.]